MRGNIALLVLAGGLLFFIEMWVPGMVAGIAGAVAWVAALALTYTHFGTTAGHALLLGMILGGGALFIWWMRVFPTTRFGRKWILEAAVHAEPQITEAAPHVLLNEEGVALTPLRPAGAAKFGERRVDVVTAGDWIEPQTPVRVIRVEGTKVVVRAI